MKRNNIRSTKVYIKENGSMITKFAVQVRLRGKQDWIQAKKGEEVLIFDTQDKADKIVIDYIEEIKKTFAEKLQEGKIKPKMRRK